MRFERNPWIECYRPRPGAELSVFCFPFAGGGAQVFREWGDRLPEQVELLAVQLPGRWSRHREPLFTHVLEAVRGLAIGLRPALTRRFAFLGYSLGGLIAFELACHLSRQGGPIPVHLFVVASRPPDAETGLEPIYRLPDAELIRSLRSNYDGIPKEILDNPDLLELFLPVLRADLEMFCTYRLEAFTPTPCPVSAFGGAEDTMVTPEQLSGWAHFSPEPFCVETYPGQHFFLQRSGGAFFARLSQQLAQLLERSSRAG